MPDKEYKDLEDEYEMLHKEISNNMEKVLKVANIYFPLAVTALGFAIKNQECIISIAIFIFSCIMVSNQIMYRKSTFRNATYCEVFLESKLERKWEKRLFLIEKIEQNENRHKIRGYKWKFVEWIILQFVAVFVFWSTRENAPWTDTVWETHLNMLLLVIFSVMILYNTYKIKDMADVVVQKEKEKCRWEKVQRMETKQQKEDIEETCSTKREKTKTEAKILFLACIAIICVCLYVIDIGIMMHRNKILMSEELGFIGSILGGGMTLIGVIITIIIIISLHKDSNK